jgi:hypothetical protein
MTRYRTIVLGLGLLPILGCNDDKIAQLQKQNEELKAQMAKQNAASDLDLQAKCSTAAKQWFNENWAGTSREKGTIFLDYSNHYNKASNKCFVLSEYHYNSDFGGPGAESWTNVMTLMDVYENVKYANFSENHITHFKPTINVGDEVITCDVQGDKCKTGDEFNNLVRPYLTN